MLDKAAVEKLAQLVRLDLSDAEKLVYSEQLAEIVKYVETLQKAPDFSINLNDMPQTAGEADELEEISVEDRKLLIEQFPQQEHDYLQVPAVFKENKGIDKS